MGRVYLTAPNCAVQPYWSTNLVGTHPVTLHTTTNADKLEHSTRLFAEANVYHHFYYIIADIYCAIKMIKKINSTNGKKNDHLSKICTDRSLALLSCFYWTAALSSISLSLTSIAIAWTSVL